MSKVCSYGYWYGTFTLITTFASIHILFDTCCLVGYEEIRKRVLSWRTISDRLTPLVLLKPCVSCIFAYRGCFAMCLLR
ncbi:hypothetical protein BD560DRAFT_396701 [Blakeslea trispora]|nr:hypothetical protein BD560DRAFT_396701 [Blakeslea trispora]